MASTLLGGQGRDRNVTKGHGTSALGPSDTSDSASDIVGGPGIVEGDMIGLDHGTNEDVEARPGPGADIGDTTLDSDSDSVGTGEHVTAGRDPETGENRDVMPDHIESIADIADASVDADGDDRT
jgi:hypothetical protein